MSKVDASRHSFRETVGRGATYLFSASLAAKLLGIGTLFVTGQLLSPEEFALFAIAIAWGEIFGYLTNGGMHKILIFRGRAFRYLFGPICGLSIIINIGILAIVLAIARSVGAAYDSTDVTWLLILIGLSVPVETIPRLLRAELSVGLRFDELSILNVYSALLRNGSIISLAALGFGPYSLAWPFVLVGLFEWIYLVQRTRISLRPSLPKLRLFWATARQTMWIVPGLLATSIIGNGAYMVIGLLKDKTTIGLYFFGFQLTLAVFTMVSSSIHSVFTPAFVSLEKTPRERDIAFLNALEMSTFVIFFLGFAIAAVAEPTINFIWSGKWDESVPIVQIMAVTALRPAVIVVIRAMMGAQGRWRFATILSCIDAVGILAAAAIGSFVGGLLAIAITVGIYSIISGLVYLSLGAQFADISLSRLFGVTFSAYAIGAIGLFGSWGMGAWLPSPEWSLFAAVLNGISYLIFFLTAAMLLKRKLCIFAYTTVRNLVQRPAA
jgi:O-antigen/teichoic acid export membrane protein